VSLVRHVGWVHQQILPTVCDRLGTVLSQIAELVEGRKAHLPSLPDMLW
jgi:hypothetical protein